MLRTLKNVRNFITCLPHAVVHEGEHLQNYLTYYLPTELVTAIIIVSFWKELHQEHNVFYHLCKCIGPLESDKPTMSDSYADALRRYLYISIRMSINVIDGLSDGEHWAKMDFDLGISSDLSSEFHRNVFRWRILPGQINLNYLFFWNIGPKYPNSDRIGTDLVLLDMVSRPAAVLYAAGKRVSTLLISNSFIPWLSSSCWPIHDVNNFHVACEVS